MYMQSKAYVGGAIAGTVALVAASGGVSEGASGGSVTFFRGVTADEMADFKASQILRRGGAGAEAGKYLAGDAATAERFGKAVAALTGEEYGGVLSVTLSGNAAAGVEDLGRIDQIGRAFFAKWKQLEGAVVHVVR